MTTVRKNHNFPFQRKEGMVVWRGRRLGCMEGGMVADMRIQFANFAPKM